MKQIEGFEVDHNKVLKLLKALYGLKESPALWQQTLHEYMYEMGFTPSPADPCLFTWKDVVIAIWVDDMLLSALTEEELDMVYDLLSKKFNIQNLNQSKNLSVSPSTETPTKRPCLCLKSIT